MPKTVNLDTSASRDDWCACPERSFFATGPLTIVDHGDGCAFPEGPCEVTAHRTTKHEPCGRLIEMLLCGCHGGEFGFSYDPERDWWVHFACGWPTRAWYKAAGRSAPDALRGLRPVTYHEYPVIPRTPKARYEQMDERQRKLNAAFVGRWVRD